MDANERVGINEARWCVDSETGEQCLIDLTTGVIVARKDSQGNIVYGKPN